jgi:hypothetical protein
MKQVLPVLFLASMCLAQTPAAPPAKPKIPIAEQSEYQALVIQSQAAQAQLNQAQAALGAVNTKGLELAAKILTELKLDPAKNDVRVLPDGTVGIVEKTTSKP